MKIRRKLILKVDKLSTKMTKQQAFAKLSAKTGYSAGTICTYYYADKKRPFQQPQEHVVFAKRGDVVKIKFI